ncbi:MAG: hypothetical protein RMY16_17645 [Nostoc sp. DedQUE12b]|uniref:hypothetical protein n=1 Tax=Nostoc sp. DedQUE12b TaxID=3075398 RepID=UPI002AD4ECF3|nr:hypothetical protein [Nostoc sp. DedQUE12b]MDZ8087361.1 hypothetical protein [Nostoc sp. DedQUE12b]
MSNKLAIAISDRLFWSCGFSRILYQKAWAIAELSLKVNYINAMPDCAIAVETVSSTMILCRRVYRLPFGNA